MAYELSGPALFSANKRLFASEKSLPLKARKDGSSENRKLQQQKKQAPLTSFGEDSFYLPSSAQEGDSLEDENEVPPPLPSSIPPGVKPASKCNFSDDSMGQGQQGRRDSLDSSGSGISIRERIAMIEKQLQSDSGRSDDDQVFNWKKKSSESKKEAEGLLKENKHLKEDINRLEKELEEKRRNIHILELWLSNIEDLLKNKNKHSDREMIEQLQLDLTKLRRELTQVGYRSEDAILDPAALMTELERKEREIMSKKTEVEVVSLELKRCRSECDNIEGMRRTALDSLRDLEREIIGLQDNEEKLKKTKEQLKQLKAQYDEMENYKNEAVTMIQPLQAQVDKLTRECQEKDALLHRLGDQLRQVTHRPSSALDDLVRLEQMMSSEDNNQNKIQSSVSQPLEKQRVPTRSSSMDDLLDLSSANSDHDSLEGSFPGTPTKKQRPAPYVNNRPRSADILSSGPRTQRGTHAHSRWAPSGNRSREHQQLLSDGVTRGQFVAIADYDPGLYSQSGRPGLELSLREGDQVLISGMMDQCGYYEAVVNGRSGLVPANYLQPLHINGHHVNHLDSNGAHLDHSPEQMMDLYRRLQQPNHMAPRAHKANFSAPRSNRLNGSPKTAPVLPEPPHHLHIKEILKEKSLLLSWSPPSVDHHGNSNGVKVLGYMVYVDNKEYEQLSGLHQCEVVIEGLSRDRLHCLAVQSLCSEGFASIKAELVFEGVVPQDPQTDLSSVLNSIAYKKGHKRTVMALYDYSPEQQSPNDYTALELAFHAGDVMHVYGEPRQDGFYHGKIDDKKGLVPACFVEDVSNLNKVPGKHKPSGH